MNKTNKANNLRINENDANSCLPSLTLPRLRVIYNTIDSEEDTLSYEAAISDGAIPFCVTIPVAIQLLVTMLVDELRDRVRVSSNSRTYAIDNGSDDLELEGFI